MGLADNLEEHVAGLKMTACVYVLAATALNEAVEVVDMVRLTSAVGWRDHRCCVLHRALICDTLSTTFAAQED